MCKIWRRNRNIEQTYAYIVHHQQLTRIHQKMTYRVTGRLADCQLADWSTRGLDNSRIGQVADWTTPGCHRRLCVLSF